MNLRWPPHSHQQLWWFEPWSWKKIIDTYAPLMQWTGTRVTMEKGDLERLLRDIWVDGKED